jgi:hypothetical protein
LSGIVVTDGIARDQVGRKFLNNSYYHHVEVGDLVVL